jgi:hypothetical protein
MKGTPNWVKTGDENPVLKDSGTRSTFDTGAVRDGQTGKGRMDLMPVRAMIEVSKIFEAGAIKYESRNWEKGIPLSRYMDSGLRHAIKFLRGDRDEPHLAQACWNFLCLLDTQIRIQEGLLDPTLNDLPCNPIAVTLPFEETEVNGLCGPGMNWSE